MGKKSPSPPDVVGAAETEGAYSRETARDVTYADRPDQSGPLGQVRWGQEQGIDPATGEPVTKWTQNQTLDPSLQSSLDSSLGMMSDRADLANTVNQRTFDEMGEAPDWAQFGEVEGFDPTQQRQAAEDAAYGRSTSRLDPRYASEANALEIKMRNQGLSPGDQAWDSAMDTFNRAKNDAYEQARFGATSEGRDEFGVALQGNERANALRDQKIQEYLAKRGYSLSEADALSQDQKLTDIAGLVTGGSGGGG